MSELPEYVLEREFDATRDMWGKGYAIMDEIFAELRADSA